CRPRPPSPETPSPTGAGPSTTTGTPSTARTPSHGRTLGGRADRPRHGTVGAISRASCPLGHGLMLIVTTGPEMEVIHAERGVLLDRFRPGPCGGPGTFAWSTSPAGSRPWRAATAGTVSQGVGFLARLRSSSLPVTLVRSSTRR